MVSCGMHRGSGAWHWNGLKLSNNQEHTVIWPAPRPQLIWVAWPISTKSLASSQTSVYCARSQRTLQRRHHVYHHCARPSRRRYKVRNAVLKKSFIYQIFALSYFHERFSTFTRSMVVTRETRKHLCCCAHRGYFEMVKWNGPKFLNL